MDSSLWLSIGVPIIVGVVLSFSLEQMLQPTVLQFWKRPLRAFAIHFGLWLVLFVFELALFQRPWFAVANVSALFLLIILVSNAKFQTLREPFIFQDFEYFTDALKHPRLYIPFLGWSKICIVIVCFLSALFCGLRFEYSLFIYLSFSGFILLLAGLTAVGLQFLWFGARKKQPITLDPEKDLEQLGLVTTLWRYGEAEKVPVSLPVSTRYSNPPKKYNKELQHLVVVQSESFFDVRQIYKEIRPEILQEFDVFLKSSLYQGKLKVPAWGANTVRTEFAFLSGLTEAELAIHRFNPYRKLARQNIPTVAAYLRNLGYRTVCVHPYPESFYSRNKVFPLFGFDEFIDIRSFGEGEKSGPYIGDVAVARRVCSLLNESSTRPIFVFVITMENHGPLHLEKVHRNELEQFYLTSPPDSCLDLTIYLRHLKNADKMLGMIGDCLHNQPVPAWLCWVGDHVPIMPDVYAEMGSPDGRTDYLIWKNKELLRKTIHLDMEVENLARLLLREMGFVDISD